MKKKLKRLVLKLKQLDKRHYAAVVLLAVSASLFFLCYHASRNRFIASCWDLVTSCGYWAADVFGLPWQTEPTVTMMERVDASLLPFDLEAIRDKFLSFGLEFFNGDLFLEYNALVLQWVYKICLIVSMLLPAVMMLKLSVTEIIFSKNSRKTGYRSKPLRIFLAVERITVYPVGKKIREFVTFFAKKKYYKVLFLAIWLLNTNVISIGLEAIAVYYWFLIGATVQGVLMQLVKLFIDLLIMWFSLPVLVWVILFYLAFDYCRRKKGYEELQHQEAENCGFLKKTGYISIAVGPPGVGKTAFVTDAAESWVNIYKEEARQLIADDLLIFPEFPFLVFEQDIRERIGSNEIFNVPSAEAFAHGLWNTFAGSRSKADLYGYDFKRFGLEKNLGNRMETLENTLKEHAKAYFIYLCENPSLSNYPIRFDGAFDDSKFFSKWKNDFFKSKPEELVKKSFYSHILDQDLMRLGKTVDEFNPRAGTFGFGIYTNTEWGKSRGNNLTLQGVSKDAEEANQKNDLYEYAHKMCRHASTMVRGKVFFRFFGDEQRPKTLGVDLRDLVSVLTIESKSEIRLVLPHFVFGDMLYSWLYEPLLKAYFKFINLRGDETLFSYLCLKKPLSLLSVWYRRIYNIFGTYDLMIKKEAGTSYGDTPEQTEAEHHVYYMMPKKIYADRYNSDCYESFFAKRQVDSGQGINDLPTYEGLDMSIDEMKAQNDYFLMQLMKVFAGEAPEPEAVPEQKPAEPAGEKQDEIAKYQFWEM